MNAIPNRPPSRGPTVLVSLSSRFAIRNFLRTGVFERLSERVGRLVLLGHPEDLADVAREEGVEVRSLRPFRSGAIENLLNNLVFQMLSRRIENGTVAIHNQVLKRDRTWSWVKRDLLSRPFGRSLPAIRSLQWLNSRVHPDRLYGRCFREVRPDLYFATNLLDPQEATILRRARREGVVIAGQVLSWDNLTSKGLVPEPLDGYVVWNEHMAGELTQLYGVSRDRIAVTGAPQFDRYAHRSAYPAREEFLAGLGIPVDRILLTHACGTDRLVPQEPEILRAFLAALRASGLPAWHLRIRVHPFDGTGRWDRFRDEDGVSVEDAGSVGPKGWAPTGPEVDHLAHLLYHSAVVLNVASTTTVDAAALDRPVVNISFDGDQPLEWIRSCRRFYSFHHYRRIVKTGGVRVVESAADAVAEIATYLADPVRDAEGRRRIVKETCYRVDGNSSDRIARAVAGWIPTRVS